MSGQIELMIVNQESDISKLQKWQTLSVYHSYSIYMRCGGNKSWEEYQLLIRKRNLINKTLEKIVEKPISGHNIPNINETDIIVIPIEINTYRPETILLSKLYSDRGDEFRKEILGNKNSYIYTKNYGWIDRGHAGFKGGQRLIRKLFTEILNSREGSIISYEMESSDKRSGIKLLGNSAKIQFRMLKSIFKNPLIAQQITYSIFKKVSLEFEKCQEKTDNLKMSSFAEEDLPSNIINFYFEVFEYEEKDLMPLCFPLSKEQSAWIYDRYKFQKNKTFEPIIKYPSGKKPILFDTCQEMKEGIYHETISLVSKTGTIVGAVSNLKGFFNANPK